MEMNIDDIIGNVDTGTPKDRKKRLSSKEAMKMKEMMDEGASTNAVAMQLGYSRGIVREVRAGTIIPDPEHPDSDYHPARRITPQKSTRRFGSPHKLDDYRSRALVALRAAETEALDRLSSLDIATSAAWPQESSVGQFRYQILDPMRKEGLLRTCKGSGFSLTPLGRLAADRCILLRLNPDIKSQSSMETSAEIDGLVESMHHEGTLSGEDDTIQKRVEMTVEQIVTGQLDTFARNLVNLEREMAGIRAMVNTRLMDSTAILRDLLTEVHKACLASELTASVLVEMRDSRRQATTSSTHSQMIQMQGRRRS